MITDNIIPISEIDYQGQYRLEVLTENQGWQVQHYAVQFKNNFGKMLKVARNYKTWRIMRHDGIQMAQSTIYPQTDVISSDYTERQNQIIAHFQAYYQKFGHNTETKSIMVWASDFGFIYPQEVEELIDSGCEYFSVKYHDRPNMWTSPDYRINRSITKYKV
jgi:hypothetical protein